MSLATQLIVCASLGVIHGNAVAGVFAQSWLIQILSVASATFVLSRVADVRIGRVFLLAATFYIASFWVGLGWLQDSLVRQETLGMLLGSMLFALLVLALAAFPVFLFAVALLVTRRVRNLASRALVCAVSLSLAEFWRGEITGFPWLAPGYAQVDSPNSALFSLVGVHGVGLIVSAIACSLGLLAARVVSRRADRADAFSGIGMLSAVAAVLAFAQAGRADVGGATVNLKLLQTQLSLDEKFSPNEYQRYVGKIDAWVQTTDADQPITAIVTPETLIPSPWYQLSQEWQRMLLDAAARSDSTIVLGMLDHDESFGFVNRTVLLRRIDGGLPRLDSVTYTKRTLVPLGEYAPPGFGWIVELLALPASQRSPGPPGQGVLKMDGLVIKPSICLDALSPDVLRTDEDYDLLVNQANLGWFVGERIRDQFWLALRARALELDKPVVVSSNAGPTGAIDSRGRTILRVPTGAEGMFTAAIEPRRGITPYARYGDAIFFWLCAIALLATVTPVLARAWQSRGIP
jgi:apolipoprotein N-acyltransferase